MRDGRAVHAGMQAEDASRLDGYGCVKYFHLWEVQIETIQYNVTTTTRYAHLESTDESNWEWNPNFTYRVPRAQIDSQAPTSAIPPMTR